MDSLHGNIGQLCEYRDGCLMAFTETWLTDSDSDALINGFGEPIQLDRDNVVTQKLQGGGVCLYINCRWCNNSTSGNSCACQIYIGLLSMPVWPIDLSREFPQVFVTVVYFHPKANMEVW